MIVTILLNKTVDTHFVVEYDTIMHEDIPMASKHQDVHTEEHLVFNRAPTVL